MLPILTSGQIREADQYSIEKEGITSVELMERAARELFHKLLLLFPQGEEFVILCGNGNNGGDGLVLARLLHRVRKKVRVVLADAQGKRSEENRLNLQRLDQEPGLEICAWINETFPLGQNTIVVECLLGNGLKRAPEGQFLSLIAYANSLDVSRVAVDVPAGLFSEGPGSDPETIFRADYTLTFQVPKPNLLNPDYGMFTGRLEVLDIGLDRAFIRDQANGEYLTEASDVCKILPKRHPALSKHDFGHALLIAGSEDKMGAAILATQACLRSGAGLTTVHVPFSAKKTMNICAPEAMLSLDPEETFLSDFPDVRYKTAVGIGPGIGKAPETAELVLDVLETHLPKVLDADALNILAANPEWLIYLNTHTVLTPHALEFDRLTHTHASWTERITTAREFALKRQCVLVLKAPHTMIFSPDGRMFYNSTGNAGLAKGGSGDVLTGMLTAYLAQGITPLDAAIAAVYNHGLAADLAVREISEKALLAGDLVDFLKKV